jgi:hypothetical protein
MHLVAKYRRFATDYRRLAAKLTKPADKQALELFAVGWDRSAENREAMLRSEEQAEPNQSTSATGPAPAERPLGVSHKTDTTS